jgi:hypothetical protein
MCPILKMETNSLKCWYLSIKLTIHKSAVGLHLNINRWQSTTILYESFFNPLKTEFIYKNSVRTSQETHYVSATMPNRLMLFREIVTVYCENHTEHRNTLCGQNVWF